MKLLGIFKKLLFNGSPETSEKNETLDNLSFAALCTNKS